MADAPAPAPAVDLATSILPAGGVAANALDASFTLVRNRSFKYFFRFFREGGGEREKERERERERERKKKNGSISLTSTPPRPFLFLSLFSFLIKKKLDFSRPPTSSSSCTAASRCFLWAASAPVSPRASVSWSCSTLARRLSGSSW